MVTVIDAKDWHALSGEVSLSHTHCQGCPVIDVLRDADGQAPADTEQEDIVWGVAYRIDEAREEEVREYMGA